MIYNLHSKLKISKILPLAAIDYFLCFTFTFNFDLLMLYTWISLETKD